MPGHSARRRARLRQKFFTAQQGKCWLCGEQMKIDGDKQHKLFATWDHVMPRARGGSGHQSNLMLAHKACNNLRSDRGEVRAIDPIAASVL